jgi:hypothetical protein
LYADGLDAMFGFEFGDEVLGRLCGRFRGVVDYDVAALAGERTGDFSANAWNNQYGDMRASLGEEIPLDEPVTIATLPSRTRCPEPLARLVEAVRV